MIPYAQIPRLGGRLDFAVVSPETNRVAVRTRLKAIPFRPAKDPAKTERQQT